VQNPIFKEAFENIIERKMTMELSMTIALLSALAIGEFFAALVITGVLAAEVLEGLTVGRGRRAIQDLLDFLPRTVSVRRNNEVIEIPAENLRLSDAVIVKPGGRIPCWADVLLWSRRLSRARQCRLRNWLKIRCMQEPSINPELWRSGQISWDATRRSEKLSRLSSERRNRAPIQKTADRLAGYLVYFALGAAVLTFIITHNLRSTISVVIVAGACGIAARTPLAILGAIGRAAHKGAIVKGGLYLESIVMRQIADVSDNEFIRHINPKGEQRENSHILSHLSNFGGDV
jgi:Cu+-exporting ATPase